MLLAQRDLNQARLAKQSKFTVSCPVQLTIVHSFRMDENFAQKP
jgi:hypothetical protein